MSFLHLAYIIARRRISAAWRLELVLFLGILLSVALLSSSVVFSDLLAEAALRRALQEADAEEVNFWVRTYQNLEEPSIASQRTSVYQSGINFVDERVTPIFSPYLEGQARLLETSTFFFTGDSRFDLPQDSRPRGRIQYMTGLFTPERSDLVEGRWPGEPTGTAGEVLEVVVEVTGAELVDLKLGDEWDVMPATGSLEHKTSRVRIVGIFQRVAPDDDFWHGRQHNFSNHNGDWATVPLFTTEAAILEQIAFNYPGIYSNVTWIYDLDRLSVGAGEVDYLKSAIWRTRNDIYANLDNSTVGIKLERLLDRYSEQLTLSRIPLFLMVFLVIGILAYYLALVSALTVRSRSAEIAMLKSRGATTLQIGLMVLVEGLLLAIPAVVVGTLLAPPVAGTLGSLLFDIEGNRALIALSSQAFLLGAGGAILSVVVLTLATLVAARQGIVEFRQAGARPPRAPLLHRYYLDFLLLAFIGLIWWQIQSRDTFLLRPVGSGELEIDFTLLLGPVLGLLALGLIVLRFFPLAVALLSRLAEPVGAVWLVQGLRRAGRDPIALGSLVVLLMLSTALGVIGSAFSSTLERSQEDRARYQVGTDLWIQHNGDQIPVTSIGLDDLNGPDGAAGQTDAAGTTLNIAEASRVSGNLLTQGFSSARLSILAIDTDDFAQAAWFRPDFAGDQSLEQLTARLKPTTGEGSDGIELPPDATGLSMWVNPGQPGARLTLRARLRDAEGYYFDSLLGDPQDRGWQQISGELTPAPSRGRDTDPEELRAPFTLVNIHISSSFGLNEPGILFIDEIAVITPAGEDVISDFRNLQGWQVVEDYTRPGLYVLESSESVVRVAGQRSAAFSWAPGGVGLRGIRPGSPAVPIPAIVSPEVLTLADAEPGDVLKVSVASFALPIKVVAVADYFPTLDPRRQPFVVLDLETFILHANRHGRRIGGGPNELWAATGEPGRAASLLTGELEQRGLQVKDYLRADEEVLRRVEQPLANASWGGLLALMFLALVLASASGVVLFSYIDTGERRTEFALLRTLGSSARQLNGMVWFNLLLMLVCGVGLGTWAGQQIGAALLPVLEVSEGGVRVTPPMVLQTNWLTLLVAYLALAAVAAGNVVWLAWFTARLEVQQVLRAGEAA